MKNFPYVFLLISVLFSNESNSAAGGAAVGSGAGVIEVHKDAVTSTHVELAAALNAYYTDPKKLAAIFAQDMVFGTQPLVYSADTQTGGIGSGTNSWASPLGGVYMSVAIPLDLEREPLDRLRGKGAQIGGASVCQALREDFGEDRFVDATVFWASDVVLLGRKCAGILPQSIDIRKPGSYKTEFSFLLISVGINVKMTEEEAADYTTAFKDKDPMGYAVGTLQSSEAGATLEPEEVRRIVSSRIIRNVQALASGEMTFEGDIVPYLRKHQAGIGTRIKFDGAIIEDGKGGRMLKDQDIKIEGLNDDGSLLCEGGGKRVMGRARPWPEDVIA
jgi:biotin-(acetyl-CoA carboxylase) ligase